MRFILCIVVHICYNLDVKNYLKLGGKIRKSSNEISINCYLKGELHKNNYKKSIKIYFKNNLFHTHFADNCWGIVINKL